MNDEKVLLTDTVSASWSADGSRIVYSPSVQNTAGQKIMNLYRLNADSTRQIKITNNILEPFTYSNIFISSNGSKIVYTSWRERLVTNTSLTSSLMDVYSNIDGSNETRITNSLPQSGFWLNGNWAMDNERILLFHAGIRILGSMSVQSTRDNSAKYLSSSWTRIYADLKQF